MGLVITPTHPDADSYVSLSEATSYLANRTGITDWSALTSDQKETALKIATKQIDSFRYRDLKMYDVAMDYRLEQALQFPRNTHPTNTAVVQTASTLAVSIGVSDAINQPNDYWNNGAVIVVSGTGRGQIRLISDFNADTGVITISEAWTTIPDTTSQLRLVKEILKDIKYATIEQALYLSKGGGERARLQSEGVTSYTIGDLSETFGGAVSNKNIKLSIEAQAYLNKYISRIGRFC